MAIKQTPPPPPPPSSDSAVPCPLRATSSVGVSVSLDGINRLALFVPFESGENRRSTANAPDGTQNCLN